MRCKTLMLLGLALFVTSCAVLPGGDQTCPIRPVYTEEEIEHWSDEHAEWVYAVELQGEALGCWKLEE